MLKILVNVVPPILVVLTFILTKPSAEKCREKGIERLATINIQATPEDIIVKDYVVMNTMKYIH